MRKFNLEIHKDLNIVIAKNKMEVGRNVFMKATYN